MRSEYELSYLEISKCAVTSISSISEACQPHCPSPTPVRASPTPSLLLGVWGAWLLGVAQNGLYERTKKLRGKCQTVTAIDAVTLIVT